MASSASATLHPSTTPRTSTTTTTTTIASPFPQLLHTPTGLALLELQGTINLPSSPAVEEEGGDEMQQVTQTPIGRLSFPDYDPRSSPTDEAWMRRAYLYVGQHQRLTGEVRKLPRPVAVIRRRQQQQQKQQLPRPDDLGAGQHGGGQDENDGEVGGGSGSEAAADDELEVVEIVRYKLVFSQRPEPVGTAATS